MGRKRRSNKGKTGTELLETPKNTECGTSSDSASSQPYAEYESELFTCGVSPIYGRYLKAKVDIKKGTIFLTEKYLIAGPQRLSDVVCVGCHTDLQIASERIPCPKCSWPTCSAQCADSIFHKEECQFFREKHVKPPTEFTRTEFGALTILRGLLLKSNNPNGWKTLLDLEAHNDIRKNLPLWKDNEMNVVEAILHRWRLGEYFNEDDIHTICGILEVNAFELGDRCSYRGIYPKAAMMAHDCVPNTTRFENPFTGVMDIRAAVDIKEGDVLSTCYAFSLEGSTQRRLMLSDTKFFECVCKRCCDPRELGSNLSTLLCQTCKAGEVINIGASELCYNWVCQSCGSKIPAAMIESQLLIWREVLDRVQEISNCEKFLHNCKSLFHPTHFIPFDVKFNLCQAYGRETTPLEELSETELDRKLELCKEVMKVLDIVTPGATVTRGLVLYELQAAEIIKARRMQHLRKIAPAILRRKLQLTQKVLQECIEILEMCHPQSIEYEIAQAAKKETLQDLVRWIASLR